MQIQIPSGHGYFDLGPTASATITLNGTTTKAEGGTILPYQRSGATTTVSVSGGYSGGTPPHIEWSWNGSAYATVGNEVIGSNAWSGTLPNLAGSEGTLTFRWSNSTGTTVSTYFVLGDFFLVIGDSLSMGVNVTATTTTSSTAPRVHYTTGGAPVDGAGEPQQDWCWADQTAIFGHYAKMADELILTAGVPIGFVARGRGGDQIFSWYAGSEPDAAITALSTAGLTAIKAIVMHIGSNDARGSNPGESTEAGVETQFQSVASYFNSHLPGGAKPIFVTIMGQVGATRGDKTERQAIDDVRQATLDAARDGYVQIGPVLWDMAFIDNLHPNTNAQRLAMGQRWYLSVTDTLYGTSYGRGPRLASAALITPTKTSIVFTFDKNLGNGNGTSVVGLSVFDGGVQVTITSATKTGARQITAVVSAPIVGVCTVSLGSGNDATPIASTPPPDIATVPYDTVTLPSTTTTNRPAEPFVGITASPLTPSMATAPACIGQPGNASSYDLVMA